MKLGLCRSSFHPTHFWKIIIHINELDDTWEHSKEDSLILFVSLSPSHLWSCWKREKETKRRDHISIHSVQFVIWPQIELLLSFLHLSVNTRSINPSRTHSELSRHQTFPPYPLILALSLDWSPLNAYTLKIVITVLSHWNTCGGYRCSASLSLHILFKWRIGVYWLKSLKD